MVQLTESLELLVHPGYTISKILSNWKIDEESEQNILTLKELWLDSISDSASNPTKYFAIVNSVDLPDDALIAHETSNSFRGLYRGILAHAKQCLEGRLLYFFPFINREDISVEELQGGLLAAMHRTTRMEYDAARLSINAYGEHIDTEHKAGCVDISIRDIISALRVPSHNVKLDHDKSLPLNPVIRIVQQYGPYELHAYGNPPLYTTMTQLEKLHQW